MSKLKISTGKMYINQSGLIVKVIDYDEYSKWFYDNFDNKYNVYGHTILDNEKYDLIAEIEPELHYEILRVINEYYSNPKLNGIIKKSYKK